MDEEIKDKKLAVKVDGCIELYDSIEEIFDNSYLKDKTLNVYETEFIKIGTYKRYNRIDKVD